MFSGIVKDIGQVQSISLGSDSCTLRLKTHLPSHNLQQGDSVSINGVCLTVVQVLERSPFELLFDIGYETRMKTNVSRLAPGMHVNVEPALSAQELMNGHIVQGHVDGVGIVSKVSSLGNSMMIEVSYPSSIHPYLVSKGSIAIDGVSLTINHKDREVFSVCLVPFTVEHTTLGNLKVSDMVNLESDVLGRYIVDALEERLHMKFGPPNERALSIESTEGGARAKCAVQSEL